MRGKKRPREKPPPSYKNQVSFQLKRERKRGRMKEKEQKKRKKSNPNYRIALELWEIHTKFSLFTDLNSSLLKFLSVASLGSKCQDDKCTGACFHTQISQADLVVLDPVRDPWFPSRLERSMHVVNNWSRGLFRCLLGFATLRGFLWLALMESFLFSPLLINL